MMQHGGRRAQRARPLLLAIGATCSVVKRALCIETVRSPQVSTVKAWTPVFASSASLVLTVDGIGARLSEGGGPMQRSTFSPEQILQVLRQAEAGRGGGEVSQTRRDRGDVRPVEEDLRGHGRRGAARAATVERGESLPDGRGGW